MSKYICNCNKILQWKYEEKKIILKLNSTISVLPSRIRKFRLGMSIVGSVNVNQTGNGHINKLWFHFVCFFLLLYFSKFLIGGIGNLLEFWNPARKQYMWKYTVLKCYSITIATGVRVPPQEYLRYIWPVYSLFLIFSRI